MADQALTVSGAGTGANAPLAYTVPGAGEIILKAAFARLNGGAAGAPWIPCLRVKTPNGAVMLECLGTQVAAGASADVTWFPGVDLSTQAASSGNGLQYGGTGNTYGSDNTGDWLVVETTTNFDTPPATFSLASLMNSSDSLSNYSMGFNAGVGMLITGIGTFITQYVVTIENFPTAANSVANGLFSEVQGTGTGAATATQSIANAVSGPATGLAAAAGATAGAHDVICVSASQASHTGTGREIGLFAKNAGNQAGAKSLPVLIEDHTGAAIFEVRDDGSLHGKTGQALTFDL